MIVLEIAMIVIGLVAVFVSFKVSDNTVQNPVNEQKVIDNTEKRNLQSEIQEIYDKFDEDIKVRSEDAINSAESELSHVSNEKIMGMNEYSDQVLEKMEKNHSDAVFLYNMLNEKEKELRELEKEIDTLKAGIHDQIAEEYQGMKECIADAQSVKNDMELLIVQQQSVKTAKEELQDNSITEEEHISDSEEIMDKTSLYDAEIAQIELEESEQSGPEEDKIENYTEETDMSNRNQEIIALYKKGYPVLDISKMLGMGQGEVKFVIDMHNAIG